MHDVISKARQSMDKVQGELESWMRRRTTMPDEEFKPMIGRYGQASYLVGFEMGRQRAREQMSEEIAGVASAKRWTRGIGLVALLVIGFEVWRVVVSFG